MALSDTDKETLSSASSVDPDSVTVSTSVPGMTFSTEGITAPDLIDVLQGALNDWKASLGDDASTDLTTPQGQIALSTTAIIGEKNDQLLAIANNVNPDYATGRWQDAIGRIYFIERQAATGTQVTAQCTGLVGTTIPEGSYAQDTSGYVYSSNSEATIGSSGSVDVVFTNQSYGAIECAADTLTTIYSAVDGWSGINNESSGVLGQDEESRANFELRRRNQVTLNSKNTAESVFANLLNVDGVSDAYVYSNNTTSTIEVGATNVDIPTGTCYIAVYGGDDEDIATAIYEKLNPGCATECNTSGETSYTIEDTTNYTSNYPQYTYYWTVPTTVDVYFKVVLEKNDKLASDIDSDVIDAIESSFAGTDGSNKVRIGSTIYASKFYGGVQDIDGSNINILSITISKDGDTYANYLDFGVDEIPVFNSNNVSVSQSSAT